MTDSINFHNATAEDILSLDKIRATLQRMEDTIVFRLIERTQFACNARMYEDGAFPELREKEHWTGSWLAWQLKELESSHGTCGVLTQPSSGGGPRRCACADPVPTSIRLRTLRRCPRRSCSRSTIPTCCTPTT